MLKIYRSHLFFSLIMHVAAFLSIGILLSFSKPEEKLGNTENRIVATFIYDDHANQLSMLKIKSEKRLEASKPEKSVLAKRENNHEAQAKQQRVAKRHNLENQGRQAESLISLLHAAIQAEQRYPENAEQMHRQGSVRVEFTLFEDGHVSELGVVKSSGTSSLDEAALKAVRAAAPFKQVRDYLRGAQHYNIDVIFQLT